MVRILVITLIVILIRGARIVHRSILRIIIKEVAVLRRDISIQTLLSILVIDTAPSRIG